MELFERAAYYGLNPVLAVYVLLLLTGLLFLRSSLFGGAQTSYKTMVQAVIMLLLGAGGMAVSLKRDS